MKRINQIANLSYVEWPENIEISDTPPGTYWARYEGQFTNDDLFHHALPEGWSTMPYDDFLESRREMIAQVIRAGFESIGAAPAEEELIRPLSDEQLGDAYLHPDRPFSNELAIRRVLRQLQGSVLWYEQHMDRKALELLLDELPAADVDQIRLLSGPSNISAKAKKAFEKFSTELAKLGVSTEWRILPGEQARTMHARVIADDEQTFEVPPLNSVLAGTVDSIRNSEIPLDSFEEAWKDETAVPIDDFQPTS